MDIDTAIETYLNNVQTRLKGMYCKGSDFGYFAYAPTAFAKYIEKKARKERIALEKATLADQSDYVGKIGERASFELIEARLLTSFPTAYGTTFLYRFIDTNGNVLIWFASSPMEDENVKHIKATVKAHSEREGVKQTILTRVKVA